MDCGITLKSGTFAMFLKPICQLIINCASLSQPFYVGNHIFLGLSPDLQSMEQIRRIMRPTDVPDQGNVLPKTIILGSIMGIIFF